MCCFRDTFAYRNNTIRDFRPRSALGLSDAERRRAHAERPRASAFARAKVRCRRGITHGIASRVCAVARRRITALRMRWSHRIPQLPMAVVLPCTDKEICEILIICRGLDVPVVARGSGTGLSGGAMPHGGGIILSLARMNQILELDPVARIARVQPGVRNLQVSEAAAPYGLYYAPDPSSQIACSIGGNVAENSGGVHCLKYGLTVHNVMRVRGYTIDGELLELGSAALDSPGLDLLAVVIGSEGLLLVVTEITVRLVPRPQLAQLVMASFDDVAKAADAVAAIIAAGINPAGIRMIERKATMAVEPFVNAGYDLDAQAILLAEADGTPEEVADQI